MNIVAYRKLKDNKGFLKYFKNMSWLMSEKILRMVIGLFVGVWVARYLGPDKFGLLNYTTSFVGLFTVLATFGLDGIVIRELVKNENKSNLLLGTSFWLKLIGSIGVLGILAIAINFTSNDAYTNRLVFIIASATIFQSFNVIDFHFQSKVLSRYVVYSNLISLLISSIVKVILILNEASLLAFVYVILFDSFVLACGFIYFYIISNSKKTTNKFPILSWKFDKITAILLLKDSWPLIFSGMLISIYMRIDQIMIKEMLNSDAVGQYAAAVRLSELWYFIPIMIVSSLFPAIINAKKNNEKLYLKRLQSLYDLMVWMAVAIAIPMTFLSDWIINLLYGVQFNQAGDVLMIHIWTGLFVFLGVAFGSFLTTENFTKKSFFKSILGAGVNILLNYILIPLYGIKGAALATLLGQFTANYLSDIFDKDLHYQLKMKTKSFFPVHLFRGYK